jgi:hypothetical protein
MKHGVTKVGGGMKHGIEIRPGGIHKHGMEGGLPAEMKVGKANTANPDFGKTNMNTMVGTERKANK